MWYADVRGRALHEMAGTLENTADTLVCLDHKSCPFSYVDQRCGTLLMHWMNLGLTSQEYIGIKFC